MARPAGSLCEYANPWSPIRAFYTLQLEKEAASTLPEKVKVFAVGLIASAGAALAGAFTLGLGTSLAFRCVVAQFYPLERAEEINDNPNREADQNRQLPPPPRRAPIRSQNIQTPNSLSPSQQTDFPRKDEIMAYPNDPLPWYSEATPSEEPTVEAKSIDKKTIQLTFRNGNELCPFNVTIRNQGLFESGAEVIVNAANTHLGLTGNGGINADILERGGRDYQAAHQQLQNIYRRNFPSGASALLPSGDLQSVGISHVAVVAGPGPMGQGVNRRPVTDLHRNALYSCYYNSLLLAHEAEKTSIAFSSISTGIYNFPKEDAARISTWAILDFIQAYPDSPLKTISIHSLGTDATSHIPNRNFYLPPRT